MRRVRLKALPLFVIAALVGGIGLSWINLGRWLSSSDPMSRVDVVVVPGGDPDHRLPRAIELMRQERARQVWVVTSGSGPVLNESRAIEAFAKERELKNVHVIGRSETLIRDARMVTRRLDTTEGRVKRVAVVTSPVKQTRTRLVFGRIVPAEVVVWSDGSRFEAARWWRAERADTLLEGTKLLATLALVGPGVDLAARGVPVSLALRALIGAFLVCLLVGAICRPLARRLRLVAVPRLWRAHSTPTPMLGGLAILAGLGAGVLAAGGVRLDALGAAAAAGVILVALVGFADDIAGLGAFARLFWAALAGGAAWLLGLRAHLLLGGATSADVVNLIVTLLWFVGITHALNVLDHIDGATAGVGAVAAGTLAVAGALGGQFVVAIAGAALAGACLGYLVHNIHPARLFMGDMGALGMGFALASLSLSLTPEPRPPLSMAVPVIALGVPIFDTILVTVHRIRAKRGVSVGGTDHTSHRLIEKGLTVRQSAAFLWTGQAVLGVVAVVIARSAAPVGWLLVGIVALAGIASMAYFLRLPAWRPPWQLEASSQIIHAVERAMATLRQLEDTVGREDWELSDPRAAKSTAATLRQLARVRRLLERGTVDELP